MRLEISLQSVLIVFAVLVWLSAVYMKIIVRQLKKQLNSASGIDYLGKARCESAMKNINVLEKFYKIVVGGLLILIVLFIGDEMMRMFAFFRSESTSDEAIRKLINVNFFLGVLAYSGFWYMVRDVRNYSVALVVKCKELKQ